MKDGKAAIVALLSGAQSNSQRIETSSRLTICADYVPTNYELCCVLGFVSGTGWITNKRCERTWANIQSINCDGILYDNNLIGSIVCPKIKTIDQWFSRDNIIIIFFYWQRLLLLLPELYSPKWNGIRRRRRPCDGRVTMHTNHRSVWVHLHLSYPSVSFWMNNHPAQTNKQQQIINKKLKTQNGIICAQEKNKKRKLLILLEVFFLSLFFFWTHRITFFSTLQSHW